MATRRLTLIGLTLAVSAALAQTRPTPPARDPFTPGYPAATELADGRLPSVNQDGNFILGPIHASVAESLPQLDVRWAPSLSSL